MFSGKLCGAVVFATLSAAATPFTFSTGAVTGSMAMASRPAAGGNIEIEAGDDFVTGPSSVAIGSVTFTGLLTGGSTADVSQVVIEIYRVFPLDSDTGRTPQVPTRVNSPADVALQSRDSATAGLTYTVADLGAFAASNSVLNGINPKPSQTTGGEGAVTGEQVRFNVALTTPIVLPAGHYFFIPQVATTSGRFYWLSGSRPIDATGTPFVPDLQAWIRNENLAPDWLRVGTDIVGGQPAPTFNGAFTLSGDAVPEPATLALVGIGGLLIVVSRRRRT